MVDVPLLRKELEFITAHPEQHKQQVWLEADPDLCGTVGCLAGNTVLHADRAYGFSQVLSQRTYWLPDTITPPAGASSGVFECLTSYNHDEQWVDLARKLLGLSWGQARRLFVYDNRIEDLWKLANEFSNGEIEVPPELSCV